MRFSVINADNVTEKYYDEIILTVPGDEFARTGDTVQRHFQR